MQPTQEAARLISYNQDANMETYSAYLFDMDGALVNSEKFKGMVLSKTCVKFGGQADINTYKAVMGESWAIVTSHFFKAARIAPGLNEFNSEFQKIYQKLLSDNLSLNPSAKDLLIKLKARNKKTAVVSSGATWMVNQILSQLELSKFFNLVITREHVKKHYFRYHKGHNCGICSAVCPYGLKVLRKKPKKT